jgi:hypothetical protein
MRKAALAILIILITSVFSGIHAQRIMGAVVGGFNTTNVQGDDVFGFYKFGLNVGAAAIVPLSEKFSMTFETIYSEKGAYHKEGGRGMDYRYRHDYNHYKLTLNYLEAPLVFHYNDPNGIHGGIGLSYARLINVKEWEDHVRIATTTLNDGPYSLDDWSLLFDAQIDVFKKMKFGARYSFSLFKIRERQYSNVAPDETKIRKQYNQTLSFRVFWIFNQQASERSKLNL